MVYIYIEVYIYMYIYILYNVSATKSCQPGFEVFDGDPPVHDFAPVFIEETLMLRKDLRIRELQRWHPDSGETAGGPGVLMGDFITIDRVF